MGKNSKRPKSYYINNAKRRKPSNELGANMVGFLCTCNTKEKQCVREAYNILNEFADKLYGDEHDPHTEVDKSSDVKNDSEQTEEESTKTESDSEDIESSLKKEVEALQDNKKPESRRNNRFQQVFVNVHNCIFISTTLENPLELSLAIMDNILETKKMKTQNLVRMVPVQLTCKAYSDEIEKTCKKLIEEHFPNAKISFYVAFRNRNNNSLNKEDICKSLSDMICNFNQEAFPDYKTPDFVLNIDVVKNICCLGLLPQYLTKYCKYNLIQLSQPSTPDIKSEKTTEGNTNE